MRELSLIGDLCRRLSPHAPLLLTLRLAPVPSAGAVRDDDWQVGLLMNGVAPRKLQVAVEICRLMNKFLVLVPSRTPSNTQPKTARQEDEALESVLQELRVRDVQPPAHEELQMIASELQPQTHISSPGGRNIFQQQARQQQQLDRAFGGLDASYQVNSSTLPGFRTYRGGAVPREAIAFFQDRASTARANSAELFDFTYGSFRSHAFLATAVHEPTAMKFLRKSAPHSWVRVKFIFFFDRERKCLHANYISGVEAPTVAEGEKEILLPPFSVFRARKVTEKAATALTPYHYVIEIEVSHDNVEPRCRHRDLAPQPEYEPLSFWG